jgi:hypothetical protein
VKTRGALARFFAEERDGYVLGLLRLAISVLLLINCARLALELNRGGYFGDFFHIPMIPESWLPTSSGYTRLLGLQALAAVFAFLGLWPREALFVASSLGLYFLSCDRLQYHNNRYALLLLGFVLAFAPCDRSFLIARGRARALVPSARLAPSFARRLFQVQVSLVYLGSAGGKLLDADWRGGQVLLMRFSNTAQTAALHGFALPAWLNLALSSLLVASLAAKVAISSELFIALGSWLPRTRRVALWVGLLFHLGIEISARVELFSWLMSASYLAFVRPEVRERTVEIDPGRTWGKTLARLLPWLDWLARFELTALAEQQTRGPSVSVTGRDGRRVQGMAALVELAAAIPLLFPLWLPLSLIVKSRRLMLTS